MEHPGYRVIRKNEKGTRCRLYKALRERHVCGEGQVWSTQSRGADVARTLHQVPERSELFSFGIQQGSTTSSRSKSRKTCPVHHVIDRSSTPEKLTLRQWWQTRNNFRSGGVAPKCGALIFWDPTWHHAEVTEYCYPERQLPRPKYLTEYGSFTYQPSAQGKLRYTSIRTPIWHLLVETGC